VRLGPDYRSGELIFARSVVVVREFELNRRNVVERIIVVTLERADDEVADDDEDQEFRCAAHYDTQSSSGNAASGISKAVETS